MVRYSIWLAFFATLAFCVDTVFAQNINYNRTGPGGDFRHAPAWSPFSPNFPLIGPGGQTDRAIFNLGRTPFQRYTITNVNGTNDQLIVRDDSLVLEVTNYEVISTGFDSNASILVGHENGDNGFATINGSTNAALTSVRANIGQDDGAVGLVWVEGHLDWATELIVVGDTGTGTLRIREQALVTSDDIRIAENDLSQGNMIVEGNEATGEVDDDLFVGINGLATAEIIDGGLLIVGDATVVSFRRGNAQMTIDGEGSHLESARVLVGHGFGNSATANGELTVQNSGSCNCNRGTVGSWRFGRGNITVNGVDSIFQFSDEFNCGFYGDGFVNVQNGGTFSGGHLFIGRSSDNDGEGRGEVTVSGIQSQCNFEDVSIGGDSENSTNGGLGFLEIQSGGNVTIENELVLFPGGQLRLDGGTLSVEEVRFENGGEFDLTTGTLSVEQFHGDLQNEGATLMPGQSAGTTTILGVYEQEENATLLMEIGGLSSGSQHDFVAVTENVFLNGQLNVELLDDFNPVSTDSLVLLESTGGAVFGTFANVGDGQRLSTAGGEGSFLVRYGVTSPEPTRIVLSDYQPACTQIVDAGVLTITGADGNDVVTISVSGTDVTAISNGCSETHSGINEIVVFGGAGDDEITINGFAVTNIHGEGGNDTILGSTGPDYITGGPGNDNINGRNGADTIDGGAPPLANPGQNILNGGLGADTIYGGNSADTIFGAEGHDIIFGYGGADTISGGLGNDTIDGGGGSDTITGNNGSDNINGGPGADNIIGGIGADTINGGGGNDTIVGSIGADQLSGGPGADNIAGGPGLDTLNGGQGNDMLNGGADGDVLHGEAGDDMLTGGPGNDQLHGGPGNDTATDTGEAGESGIEN